LKRGVYFLFFLSLVPLAGHAFAQQPMALVQSIDMPEVPSGPYADHMAIDLRNQRLFTTPQANKSVDVLDLKAGKVLHTITGFGNPHAIFYDEKRNQLFVTDGGVGAVKVFDATTYKEMKSIKVELDADGIGYDPRSGYLYVSNGGEAAGKKYSLISIIDIAKAEKIGDIQIDADGLEAMAIDSDQGRLYINLPDQSAIAVVDLAKRHVVATWPLTKGKNNMAFALDATRHRLYVGCRDTDVRGSIVIVDTDTGRELDRLPIGGWVDSMFYDGQRGLIYASCGVGEVYTYQRVSGDTFKEVGLTDTAVMAKTALYVPELHRFFVAVPHLGDTLAKILVFKVD